MPHVEFILESFWPEIKLIFGTKLLHDVILALRLLSFDMGSIRNFREEYQEYVRKLEEFKSKKSFPNVDQPNWI